MNDSSHIPEELFATHKYYNRIFFHETHTLHPEHEEFIKHHQSQLKPPSPSSRLAVNNRILNLAFSELFEILGAESSKDMISRFCTTANASTSLIVHKKIEDFYYFFKLIPKTQYSEQIWQALERGYIQYQLLYADFTLDPNDKRQPAQAESLLNLCGIQWKTPWQIDSQTLYFRNPQTLLVEMQKLRDTTPWMELKNNPMAPLSKITEKYQLDDDTRNDSETLLTEFYQTLMRFSEVGVIQIVEG